MEDATNMRSYPGVNIQKDVESGKPYGKTMKTHENPCLPLEVCPQLVGLSKSILIYQMVLNYET
jgi:hypothetical protein